MNDYDDDDDDDEEEEEEDDDDNHHQGMGCHRSALCLQRQVDKKSFLFLPHCLFLPGSDLNALGKEGGLSQRLNFIDN